MFFKHLHLYRLHEAITLDMEALSEQLSEQQQRPLGGSEATRLGWIAPGGRNSEQLANKIQGHLLLSALRQERALPASVVREEVEERVGDLEAKESRTLPRRERQQIKEQVYEELLPRAFIKRQKIDLWLDTKHGLIGINASSRARAEEVLDLLRQTLGSLKVTPLATQELPIRAMTRWLKEPENRPAWLALGGKAELRAQGDDGKLAATNVDLDSDEVQQLLEGGRQAHRLAVTLDERVTLVLHDDLSLKSLRFSDALLDEASQTNDGDDHLARLEADFILMANALGEVVALLIEGLGGEAQPIASANGNADAPADPDAGERDPLYETAAAIVAESGKASISALQRALKTGYNRACHLIEALEQNGIVSPIDNQGRRRVLAGGEA